MGARFDRYMKLVKSDDPTNIIDIETLRYYVANHGCTNKLMDYLYIDEKDIYKVLKYFPIQTPISEVIESYDEKLTKYENIYLRTNADIDDFLNKKENLCGIGITSLKRKLTSFMKKEGEGSIYGILRKMIEINEYYIKLKTDVRYYEFYDASINSLLISLIDIYEENKLPYGINKDNNAIVFELPDKKQILFDLRHLFNQDRKTYTKTIKSPNKANIGKIEAFIKKELFHLLT